AGVLVEELGGLVAEGVGDVEVLPGLDGLLVEEEDPGGEVVGAPAGAVGAVEAPVERVVAPRRLAADAADVPLADVVGAVACAPEQLGEGGAAVVEPVGVAGRVPLAEHVADARLVRVQAGQQGGPGRAAAGGVVELR